MISKAKIKLIRQLASKKGRTEAQAFLGEGHKVVGDLLTRFHVRFVIATHAWLSLHEPLAGVEFIEATADELRRASLLMAPQDVLAVFDLPSSREGVPLPADELSLALDGVQDPGNVGTIIRLADWFGIRHIFCSVDTADAFNPKVVQATMGSLARVSLHYTDLLELLDRRPDCLPVYGTLLNGRNIYTTELQQQGVIVMGNEGKGVSEAVRRRLTHGLLIPPFPGDSATAESLNVATATAITLSEFRRRAH